MAQLEYATKPLAQIQVADALGDIYVAPGVAPGIAVIQSLWICNTDSSARTVTLRYGTGTLTAANSIMEAKSIPANDYIFITTNTFLLILLAGWKLQGLASVSAKVTVSIFGQELQ